MKQIRSQPLRCPLCERGRIIDAGPMARVSQFTLYGPQYVQHAQLIAKCPNKNSSKSITKKEKPILRLRRNVAYRRAI